MSAAPATAPARPALLDVPPGLRGVAVVMTEVGDVLPDEGVYHYRGRSAVDLARSATFEQVWHLLATGELPDPAAGAAFTARVAALRTLPPAVAAALPAIGRTTRRRLLDGLRAALALLAAEDGMAPTWDTDAEQHRADALRVSAAVPTLLAGLRAVATGAEPVAPDPALGAAADWLAMLRTGTHEDPVVVAALQRYLVAAVDHGLPASTFAARVVASTGADVAAAVGAAVAAFAGPLHGGAPDRALEAVEAMGDAAGGRAAVEAVLDAGGRVMGFGHAVYRAPDPRAVLLRETALELGEHVGSDLAQRAVAVEEAVAEVLRRRRPDRPLAVNVEYYAGVLMALCGVPRDAFTATFAVARVVGWCAHVLEQVEQRRLIRPSARYTGHRQPGADARAPAGAGE